MSPETLLKYPVIFVAGLLTAYVATPLVTKLARALGMVDLPDARRIHTQPTPRGGGLAIVLGFNVACATLFLLPWTPFSGHLTEQWWLRCLLASLPLIAVGILDDLKLIPVPFKVAGQLGAAYLAFYFGMDMNMFLGVRLPWVLDLAASLLWYFAFINAFNLIDGIDGLATGLACIAAIGLGGSLMLQHMPADVLVLLGFVGACLGFLRYNFYPACVFLGDTGSQYLGFMLASIAIATSMKGTAVVSVTVPLLAVGVPLFDTLLAVWRRSVRRWFGGEATGHVFAPDAEHVHHRLLMRGHSQRHVTLILYILAIVVAAVGLLAMAFDSMALGIYLAAFMAGSYVVVRHLARVELWDSAHALMRGLRRPQRKVISVILYPVIDAAILAASLALALCLNNLVSAGVYKHQFLVEIPVWVGIPFLAIVLSGSYFRVWSRARISEYVLHGGAVTMGIVASVAIANLQGATDARQLFQQACLVAAIAVPGTLAIRMILRVVQDVLPFLRRWYGAGEKGTTQLLLYPASCSPTMSTGMWWDLWTTIPISTAGVCMGSGCSGGSHK
jgi:UDP-GlcNAc:undecaprenyl-phosphate GlcNAc-1-phosphate transferase